MNTPVFKVVVNFNHKDAPLIIENVYLTTINEQYLTIYQEYGKTLFIFLSNVLYFTKSEIIPSY